MQKFLMEYSGPNVPSKRMSGTLGELSSAFNELDKSLPGGVDGLTVNYGQAGKTAKELVGISAAAAAGHFDALADHAEVEPEANDEDEDDDEDEEEEEEEEEDEETADEEEEVAVPVGNAAGEFAAAVANWEALGWPIQPEEKHLTQSEMQANRAANGGRPPGVWATERPPVYVPKAVADRYRAAQLVLNADHPGFLDLPKTFQDAPQFNSQPTEAERLSVDGNGVVPLLLPGVTRESAVADFLARNGLVEDQQYLDLPKTCQDPPRPVYDGTLPVPGMVYNEPAQGADQDYLELPSTAPAPNPVQNAPGTVASLFGGQQYHEPSSLERALMAYAQGHTQRPELGTIERILAGPMGTPMPSLPPNYGGQATAPPVGNAGADSVPPPLVPPPCVG